MVNKALIKSKANLKVIKTRKFPGCTYGPNAVIGRKRPETKHADRWHNERHSVEELSQCA